MEIHFRGNFVEYAALSQVFVCRRGTFVRNEQELVGKVVAVQVNTTSHTWIDDVRKKGIPVREVKALPLATDVFTALHTGQVDVVVVDEPVGRYYSRTQPTLVVTGAAVDAEPIGVALRKQDRELQAALTSAVQSMQEDGTSKRLAERLFGEERDGRHPGPIHLPR